MLGGDGHHADPALGDSGRSLNAGVFLIVASVTGSLRATTGATSTEAQSSPGAVESGPAAVRTLATATTALPSFEW